MKKLSNRRLQGLLNCSPSSYIDVWIVQGAESWPKQLVDNYYTANWHHEDSFQTNSEEYQTYAYDWLRKEMSNRIEGWSGDAPIWAWLVKPNIREYMRGRWYDGDPNWVLVHARVPKSRMLWSCFALWHCCLNNGPIIPVEEWDANEEFYEVQENIEATWSKVFDIKAIDPKLRDDCGCRNVIQACVDRLYRHEIVSCDRLKGRKLVPVRL